MPIEAIAETNVAPSPDGYVYMLYSAGLIKIGFTHDPVARFDGMRSMHAKKRARRKRKNDAARD